MLQLIKENKDLIHTIKTILQVFPEGVIIRSLDQKSKQTLMKFANEIAKQFFWEQDVAEKDVTVSISSKDENLESTESTEYNVDDFLKQQEVEVQNIIDDNRIVEKLVQIRSNYCDQAQGDDSSAESSPFSMFNVKTIEVCWENNSSSYLHVFINTDKIQKLERARATNRCQQAMFASVSHEFRTPLNAFMNSLELIDMQMNEVKALLSQSSMLKRNFDALYTKYDKYVKIGRISSKILLNLIEDLLDMAKFNAGRLNLNMDEFKLSDVIQEMQYIFWFQCQEKHLDFSIKWDSSVAEATYKSDARRIKQVLINLISNSCKFTQTGKIVVKISQTAADDKQYLKFEVLDSGIGISSKDIPKLFSMFGMLDNKKDLLNKSGSGIGLSISKMLVEQLGGKIKVRSEEGKWTKFTFTIENQYVPSEVITNRLIWTQVYVLLHFAIYLFKSMHFNQISASDNALYTYKVIANLNDM